MSKPNKINAKKSLFDKNTKKRSRSASNLLDGEFFDYAQIIFDDEDNEGEFKILILEYLNRLPEEIVKKMLEKIKDKETLSKQSIDGINSGIDILLTMHYNNKSTAEKCSVVEDIVNYLLKGMAKKRVDKKKHAKEPPSEETKPAAIKKDVPPIPDSKEEPVFSKEDSKKAKDKAEKEKAGKDEEIVEVSDFTGEEVNRTKIACKRCNATSDPDAEFCEHCGVILLSPERLEATSQVKKIKRCPSCLRELDSSNKAEMKKSYCKKCGVEYDVYIKASESIIDMIIKYLQNGTNLMRKITGNL